MAAQPESGVVAVALIRYRTPNSFLQADILLCCLPLTPPAYRGANLFHHPRTSHHFETANTANPPMLSKRILTVHPSVIVILRQTTHHGLQWRRYHVQQQARQQLFSRCERYEFAAIDQA